jgi:hypothetical protein
MTWEVPSHVRKVWVHRRPPLPGRIKRKIRRVLAGHGLLVGLLVAAEPIAGGVVV